MAQELQVFNNVDFGSIRGLMINGEPWFVGKDIAERLGYSNTRDTLAKRVDEEDKGVAKCDTLGGAQELTVINESGVYSLIFSSKLPKAKQFKRWVTAEVLPAIRKHKVYAMNNIEVPLTREEIAAYTFTLFEGLEKFATGIESEISGLAAIIKEQNDAYNKNMLQISNKISQIPVSTSATEVKSNLTDVNTWLHKAWKSAEIISAKSGKDKKRMLIEAYDIVRSGGTDLTGMYREYRVAHPNAAMINMCAESVELRAKMESALKELNRNYSVGAKTAERPVYKSQLLATTPPEVRELIEKFGAKHGISYNCAAKKAYEEIERITGCDLKKDVKNFAAANGCSNASKAYYIGARKKHLDVLRQIAGEV